MVEVVLPAVSEHDGSNLTEPLIIVMMNDVDTRNGHHLMILRRRIRMDENTNSVGYYLRRYGLIVVIALFVICLLSGFASYNGMNSAKNEVDSQWSQVENVMQRRNDLIPQLESVVKGSMKNEQKVFGDIAKAREDYANAGTRNDKLKANSEISDKTNVLVKTINENYPDLKSEQQVSDFMVTIEGSENRIAQERRKYILDVQSYNNKVTSMPNKLVAGSFGFQKMDTYKADDAAKTAPKIDLE